MIEDNEADIDLALDALRQTHFNVEIRVMRNGKEAFDYLEGRGDYTDRATSPLPHFILLDLNLPGLDGRDLLRWIKTTPSLKRIPIIVLTASEAEEDIALSYDHGANSYLIKPVDFTAFLDLVKKIGEYWHRWNVDPPMPRTS
ncbi:MAG: response regulator [Deltaproteobacteria bacterium]|nr:MAG: response regulator [Deltaproteobacteria bacterium]